MRYPGLHMGRKIHMRGDVIVDASDFQLDFRSEHREPVASLGCCLHSRVVSLDKKLFSTLSLFTHVHKWCPVTYYWW